MLEAYWYIGCDSKQLRRKPRPGVIFDIPVVFFRDAHGRPWALQDRCPHRNALLSSGRVRNDCLECPYHGWQWHGDGHLHRHPSQTTTPELRVPSYPCVERDGYIWISLSSKPAQEQPYSFPYLGQAGWQSFRMHNRFAGSVDACLENFLDCPHAVFVHRRWFRSATDKRVRTLVSDLEDGAQAEYFEEPRDNSLVWWGLSPRKIAMQHTDRFIAPNTSRVDYRFSAKAHYVISSSCTPVNPNVTDVYTVITYRFGWLTPIIRLFFKPMARRIIHQDIAMVNATGNNIQRFGGPAYCVAEADLLFQAIHRWRHALRHDKSPPAPGVPREVDIRL